MSTPPGRDSGFPAEGRRRRSGGDDSFEEFGDALDEFDKVNNLSFVFPPQAPTSPPTMATGNPGAAAPGVAAATPAAASTSSKSREVPPYSGHPVGRSYQSVDGLRTELFEVFDWTLQAETRGQANKWADDVLAKQAAMSFPPATPAYLWYKLNQKDVQNWAQMRPAIEREFMPPFDAADKVAVLKSFRQERGERVSDYCTRITLSYQRMTHNLEGLFEVDPTYAAEDANTKAYRAKVIAKVLDFHRASFFLVGLDEDLMAEVTRSGSEDMNVMLSIAKRAEQARNQAVRPHRIGAVEDIGAQVASAVAKELGKFQLPASPAAAVAAPVSGSRPKGKDKDKDPAKVWCFFCLVKGHYANTCVKRNDERGRNIWRPTVRCAHMSKDAYDRLSRDDKNKGRNMISAPPPAPSASSVGGASYAATASSTSAEELYNAYYPGL